MRFTKKKKTWIAAFAVLILGMIGVAVRILGLEYLSGDMIDCYLPWYDSVPAGQGIRVLQNYEGDYGLPYATVLWLLHYIPGRALIKIKLISILFEYLAAVAVGLLASLFFRENSKWLVFPIAFGLTILYPPLIMNGAYWGQCDGVYVAFILLMLYALFRDRKAMAMVFLGIAITAKLQTIFILPFLILYQYRRRNIALWYYLIVPAVIEILYLPGILAGYSPLTPFTTYLTQTTEYPQINMNYPNLWCYFWHLADYEMVHVSYIGWVIAVLALMFVYLALHGKDLSNRTWIGVAFWSALFVVQFLPAMHERYSLLAELIAVVYAVLYPKRSWISVFLWITISWSIYQTIVLDISPPQQDLVSIGMMFVMIALTVFMVRDIRRDPGTVSIPSGEGRRETKFYGFLDRYGVIPAVLTVVGFFMFSAPKFAGYVVPDFSAEWQRNIALKVAPLRICYDRTMEIIGGWLKLSGTETAKYAGCLWMILAALLWTYIAFRDDHGEKAGLKRGLLWMAFLILPAAVFYPLILGTPDGLCLLLSGGGFLILNGKENRHNTVMLFAGALLFALASAVTPTYLLFQAFLLFGWKSRQTEKDNKTGTDKIRDRWSMLLLSAVIALLSGLTAPVFDMGIWEALLALAQGFIRNGAFLVPGSFGILLLCVEDCRFILPLLLFGYGLTLRFGQYVAGVRDRYVLLVPVLSLLSVLLILYLLVKRKRETLENR